MARVQDRKAVMHREVVTLTDEQQAKPTNEQGKYSDTDELYDLIPYSRPEDDINLVSRSDDREREVIIGGKDNDWDLYCTGYRRAATVLVNHITQKHYRSLRRDYSSYWESPAYAIIFLYRHYLELRLKELILAYGGNLSVISNEHSLLNLWKELRKQNDVQTEDLDPETLKDIETAEKIITQFDEIDKKSQAFRYPIDRTGRVTVPAIQFDLVRLKEMLGWTSQFLDGWSTGVYEYRHAHP